MRKLALWCRQAPVLCVIWIAVCYAMGASSWLSWWYNLMTIMEPVASDAVSMGAGYLLQAIGVWLAARIMEREKGRRRLLWVLGTILGFMLSATFSLLSRSLASMIFWGLVMNLVDGVFTGYYLYTAFIYSRKRSYGLLFGCGYALSTPPMYLLSLAGGGTFLSQPDALWVYLGMAVLAGGMAFVLFLVKESPAHDVEKAEEKSRMLAEQGQQSAAESVETEGQVRTRFLRILPNASESTENVEEARVHAKEVSPGLWRLALVILFLFSMVKNLGFAFPSSDVISGTNVEFSRLFYGIGLIAAGLIHDRNPKWSAICALASLVISFVMLAMEGEKVLRVVFWALDYFFFGFVAVYRVALPMDLAKTSSKHPLELALSGLVMGRLGDLTGTMLCNALAGQKLMLILLTLVLFVLALFLFFRLYLALYIPAQQQAERSEREVFEDFSIQHDLSDREKEVLRLLLSGQSNGQIAEALFVSESTIKFHVHNLLQKTGCKTRRELTEKFHLLLFPGIVKNTAQTESQVS